MTNPYDAVVIGAGHNGLVTAAYLGSAGLRVLVLERSDSVGGAAVTDEFYPGFKVNAGVHWAGSLDPTVMKDLGLERAGVEIVPADPAVFTPLPEGGGLTLWRDLEPTLESIRRFSNRDADRWPAFNRLLAMSVGLLTEIYRSPPPRVPNPSLRDMLSLARTGRLLRKLGRHDMLEVMRLLPMSVAEVMDEWFETDVLQGTIGASGIVGLAQGPMAAGTAAVMLHHEVGGSMGFVRGGVGNLTRALADSARGYGVDVRTGAGVSRILVRDGAAVGVVLEDGAAIAATRVVSNADPRRTFLGLVDPTILDPIFVAGVSAIKFRGVCAKVHLALDALPTFVAANGNVDLLTGAISVSPSIEYLERAYDDAKYGRVSSHPYLEAVIPSLTDESMAPAGKHVMSVFVQYAPYHLREGSWEDGARSALGDTVVKTLSVYAPDIEEKILHREVVTPLDLELRYGLTEGNINHGELTLDQFFFARPVPGWAQYRTPINGLFLCGAGTHGGGGLNGIPGRNAARVIIESS